MAKSKYLLSNKKKKRKIILFIVCLLVYTLLMGYVILNFVGYCNLYSEQYSVLSFINSTKLLFTPTGFSLPFDFQETLRLMEQIWYVHLTFFLLLLLLFIRRKKDDFHGVEHGSAGWASEKDKSLFTDDTGIPCGDGFYVSIGADSKRKDESKK